MPRVRDVEFVRSGSIAFVERTNAEIEGDALAYDVNEGGRRYGEAPFRSRPNRFDGRLPADPEPGGEELHVRVD